MIDGDWIKARLTGRRGEKARLSEALGLRDADISKILNGTRKVQAKEIPALLKFFGDEDLSDEDRADIALLKSVPPHFREAARALLRSAAQAAAEGSGVGREKAGEDE